MKTLGDVLDERVVHEPKPIKVSPVDKPTREEIRFEKKLAKLRNDRVIGEALSNNPTQPYHLIQEALSGMGIKVSISKLRNMCVSLGLPVRRPEKKWLRTEVKRLTAINDNINEEDF